MLFIGAPLALAASRFDMPWLFIVGVAALAVALGLPTRRDETPLTKLRRILAHLPGIGWLRPGRSTENDSSLGAGPRSRERAPR